MYTNKPMNSERYLQLSLNEKINYKGRDEQERQYLFSAL